MKLFLSKPDKIAFLLKTKVQVGYYLTSWLIIFNFLPAFGQVRGLVSDEKGLPLSFASVYIEGTTHGTNSNVDGEFILELARGSHVLVFQYMGYESKKELIQYKGEAIYLKINLRPSELALSEFVVSSKQRDPAYEIIEKAISKRAYFEKSIPSYACQAYTKGMMRVLNAPKKILGQEVGNMGGNLDSNRQGIVYLSETVSNIQFIPPAHFEEKMLSSKISGNDNGFSFNRASSMNFNLYKNVSPFGREIISPIADFALAHYDYKLLSSEKIANGNLVYKIQLLPKIKEDAVWSGIIYIQENAWNIYAFDGLIRGFQVKQPIFDSIILSQTHFPVKAPDIWHIQSQSFRFTGGIFNFKVAGNFTLVFSDYIFDQTLLKKKKEVLTVETGANEKSISYWDSIRPMPLTVEELKDYLTKDSLKFVRETKTYKDSVDKHNNQFKGIDLIMGYTYDNTYKRKYYTLESPLEVVHFNPVQGLVLGTKFRYSHYLHKTSWHDRFSVEGDIFYGFSDRNFRGGLQLMKRYDRRNTAFARIQFSNRVQEFNSVSDVSNLYNELLCFFWRENQLKLFDRTLLRLDWGSYINYDVFLYVGAEYQNRKELINNSNFSFVDRPVIYQANNQTSNLSFPLNINERHALRFFSRMTWRPSTKVWVLPDDIDRVGSSWPKFVLDYQYYYYPGSNTNFHLAGVQVSKEWSLSRWGELQVFSGVRKILSKQEIDVPDRLYQRSSAMFFYNIPNQENYFMSLPLYGNISSNYSAQVFAEHDFKGLLLDRIPLIRKLGLTEIVRGGIVYTPESKWAGEWSAGIGNIGIGVFRLLRLDFAFRYDSGNRGTSYIRLGLVRNLSAGR